MKIIRDGNEIELTKDEVREAGWEYDRYYRIEDLLQCAELIEIEPDENKRIELAKKIEPNFEEFIGCSDDYWCEYWNCARNAIADYIDETGVMIEKTAREYESGKMLRDDSEVEIDVVDDEVWLCDYSESRGGAEFIKKMCNLNETTYDTIKSICSKHGWNYVI